MVKRISIFIFSCTLLHWTAPSTAPSPHTTDALQSNAPSVATSPAASPHTTTALLNKTPSIAPSPHTTAALQSNAPSVASSPHTTTALLNKTPSVAPSPHTTTALPYTNSHSGILKTTTAVPSNRADGHGNPADNSEKRYLWIMLPILCILLAAMIYLKFKCKKVQHWPEMTDNGTENASFQRTDSNKDGVMLLGVSKTSVGEDYAAAR